MTWELKATNFSHPSITSGQHTNGPAHIWARFGDGEWFDTQLNSMYKARGFIAEFGHSEQSLREALCLPAQES